MSNQTTFKDLWQKNLKTLTLYVPTIAKVHGGHNPELHDVRETFNIMAEKIGTNGAQLPDLTPEFETLRTLTSNYIPPPNACETYIATYEMLAEMDKAYNLA